MKILVKDVKLKALKQADAESKPVNKGCLWHCALIILTSFFHHADLHAQMNPPFNDPSLDSNCYFPQIGDLSEMDTIMGWDTAQYIGQPLIKNLGPKPSGGYGNMFIGNLTPPPLPTTYSFYTLSQVETGPGFDLHRMKQYLQRITSAQTQSISDYGLKPIHFRDRTHLDLFVPSTRRIYLADDAGNYDSLGYAVIMSSLHGDNADTLPQYAFTYDLIGAYITRLTQDTVDDIVTSLYTDYRSGNDTSYLLLFKGRKSLHVGDTIYEDTSCLLFPNLKNYPYRRSVQGDFRGTGREDLIIAGDTGGVLWPGSQRGNLFFFPNDPPFTLEKLAHAINYDTIMAGWQNPSLLRSTRWGFSHYYGLRALSKSKWDRSVDFLPVFYDASDSIYGRAGIYFFRGGPNFGSHRITLDTAVYVIKRPSMFILDEWPADGEVIVDAGDMTGTGSHVLCTSGSRAGYEYDMVSFVTGEALDDKIDMFSQHPYGGWPPDTLTANGDNLEDLLVSLSQPYYDLPNGVAPASGALWLYYGTKKIPVHLNPKFANVGNIPKKNGAGVLFSPNPVTAGWSVATIVWPEAEEATYEINNLLGELIQTGSLRMLGGAEQQRMYFPNIASGVYYITLHGLSANVTAKLVIAH